MSRASFRAGAGGGSRKLSVVGSVTPQAAQSSRSGRKIGGEDFGPRERFERPGAGLFPQAIADAGLGASRATPALIGGGARDAHGLEPGQTDIRLVDAERGRGPNR